MREVPPLMAADRDVQPPEGWYVTWCPGCLYSVSFTDADASAWGIVDDSWRVLLDAAVRHDCPALVPA